MSDTALVDYIAKLKSDYVFFSEQLWDAMDWTSKAPIGWPEREMMEWLAEGPDECGILSSRGIGKTHNVVAFVLWSLLRDCDTRIVIASKSAEFAVGTVEFLKDCIKKVPFLRHLTPRKGQKDAAYAFSVGPSSPSRQPSVRAYGIEGSIEGNRAHIVIADDVEQDTNSETFQAREKLFQRVNEFSALMYRPEPGETVAIRRRIVYVGTFHAEPIHSLYYRLHMERGIAFRTWPLCYPRHNERCLSLAPGVAERLAANPSLVGTSVFDHRIGPAEIAKQFAKGRTYWNRQQMLLVDDERGTARRLSLDDLVVMDVDAKMAPPHVPWGMQDHNGDTGIDDIPTLGLARERLRRPPFLPKERIPYKQTVAYLDPAGCGEDEACLTVIGTLGALFHVKLCRGVLIAREFSGNQYKAIRSMVADAQRLGATRLAYEGNVDVSGGFEGNIQAACRELNYKVSVEKVHTAGVHKNVRILRLLEPVMSRHRLIIDRKSLVPDTDLDNRYQLQWQLSHLSEERDCLQHDDRIDSLAGAIAMLESELERDVVTAGGKDHEDGLVRWMEQIDKAMDRQASRGPAPRWMDRRGHGTSPTASRWAGR